MTSSEPTKFYFLTTNEKKYLEIKKLLEINVHWLNHDILEIQGDPDRIIRHKLNEAEKYISDDKNEDKIIMVDDTSFEMTGLDGFPGPYIKDFLKIGAQKIYDISLRVGKDATITTYLGLSYRNNIKIFVGTTQVQIGPIASNHNKLYFDAIIYVNGKAFSEMSIDEKNLVSARSKACKSVRKFLECSGLNTRLH